MLVETVMLTYLNVVELDFRRTTNFEAWIDPMSIDKGFSGATRVKFLKYMFIITVNNHLTMFSAKITIILFYYEIFINRLRKILHVVLALVLSCFLANLLESLFWCYPHSTMWTKTPKYAMTGGYCVQRIIPLLNAVQYGTHVSSTAIVILLPIILLLIRKVQRDTAQMAFAVSILGFGLISIATTTAGYLVMKDMPIMKMIQAESRHNVITCSIADQTAIFLAASLGVLRFRRANVQTDRKENEVEMVGDSDVSARGLVIEVEQSYSVSVEIVDAWGQGPPVDLWSKWNRW